jgi:hypothetical protein
MNRCRKRTPFPHPSEGRGKDLRRSAWFRGTRREVVRGKLSLILSLSFFEEEEAPKPFVPPTVTGAGRTLPF